MSSSTPSPLVLKSRGRLAAWLAFGAVGLATGAVWASGFASGTGANGATVISPALTKTAPTRATSALSGTTTARHDARVRLGRPLGLDRRQEVMFKVDLSGADYAGKTYNIALLLANTSDMTGWASMQLKLECVDVAASGTCVATAVRRHATTRRCSTSTTRTRACTGTASPATRSTASASAPSPGDEAAGTFLRAAQDTPPTAFPTFITTVDRASS